MAMPMFSRACAASTLAVIATVAMAGHVQAQTVLSTTADLSNLRYRLIDLDPNDGIDPWVAFGAAPSPEVVLSRATQDGLQQTQFFSSYAMDGQLAEGSASAGMRDARAIDIFGPESLSITDPNGTVAFGKGDRQLYSQMSLTADQLLDARNINASTTDLGFLAIGSIGIDTNSTVGVGFVLSPKTRMVLEADMTAVTAFDEDALRSSLAAYLQGPAGKVNIELKSTASLGVQGMNHINSGYLPYFNLDGQGANAGIYIDMNSATTLTGNGGLGLSPQSLLSGAAVFINSSPWESSGTLGYNVITSVSVKASGLVPEPGTWALMGLGLAGLSVVAGQRHKKQQITRAV